MTYDLPPRWERKRVEDEERKRDTERESWEPQSLRPADKPSMADVRGLSLRQIDSFIKDYRNLSHDGEEPPPAEYPAVLYRGESGEELTLDELAEINKEIFERLPERLSVREHGRMANAVPKDERTYKNGEIIDTSRTSFGRAVTLVVTSVMDSNEHVKEFNVVYSVPADRGIEPVSQTA